MTTNSEALVFAYRLDGKRRGVQLPWSELTQGPPDDGLLWMHLDSTHSDAREWLRNKSGISPLICESLLEEGTRPRSMVADDGLLVILRGVNCNPGHDPEDMVAVRMFLTRHRIITLRYRRVMAIQDIKKAIEDGQGPRDTGDALVMVADRIADRMGEVVSELDDRIDELEDSVLTTESRELQSQLADLRRTAIGLRRYIAPQRDALSRLVNERIDWMKDAHRAHLREITEHTARYIEDVDAARERAAITQEELNSRLSERMNHTMYILSLVAAIFLPLGLLTGLLGINVGGIPGSENPWAFTLVSTGLIAIAILLILWFKKMKWM
jgi:zinc transporter